jgi:hypothetical protein
MNPHDDTNDTTPDEQQPPPSMNYLIRAAVNKPRRYEFRAVSTEEEKEPDHG